jgi:hypothetical protein
MDGSIEMMKKSLPLSICSGRKSGFGIHTTIKMLICCGGSTGRIVSSSSSFSSPKSNTRDTCECRTASQGTSLFTGDSSTRRGLFISGSGDQASSIRQHKRAHSGATTTYNYYYSMKTNLASTFDAADEMGLLRLHLKQYRLHRLQSR